MNHPDPSMPIQTTDRDFRSRGWHDIPKDSPLRMRCYLCGADGSADEPLQVEHVIPKVVFRHFRSTKPWRYELKPCG